MFRRFALVVTLGLLACRTPALYSAPPALSSSPSGECPAPVGGRVRFASFNIKYAEGDRLTDVARFLVERQVDLVALQEVDRGTRRSGGVDTPARLAELAGGTWHFAFAAARAESGGEFGVAILSRVPFAAVDRYELADAGGSFERRVALRAVLCTARRLEIVTLHADVFGRENAANARSLLQQLPPIPREGTRLIAGDLNAEPGTDAARVFAEHGLHDLLDEAGQGAVPTFGWHRIDYLLAAGALVEAPSLREAVSDVVVFSDVRASDHVPVGAVLQLDSL